MVAIADKSFSREKKLFSEKSALLEKIRVGEFVYIDALSFYDVNGTKYYPLQGSNMNIEAVADASGAIVESYEISAFGNVKILAPDGTERSSTAVGNNHYFQGRDLDSESGFIYFRNRWMSSELGRFISKDPLRFEDDPVNLYRFVGNNSLRYLDPLGLAIVDIIDGVKWKTTTPGSGNSWGHSRSPFKVLSLCEKKGCKYILKGKIEVGGSIVVHTDFTARNLETNQRYLCQRASRRIQATREHEEQHVQNGKNEGREIEEALFSRDEKFEDNFSCELKRSDKVQTAMFLWQTFSEAERGHSNVASPIPTTNMFLSSELEESMSGGLCREI